MAVGSCHEQWRATVLHRCVGVRPRRHHQDAVAAQKELEAAAKPEPEPELDAAGIVRYFAQQRAAGHAMTVWDSMGNNNGRRRR